MKGSGQDDEGRFDEGVTERGLLAVDLGLRTGVAYFEGGQLRRYRSQNFGSRDRLRRGAYREVMALDGLTHLVVEGDPALARHWRRAAEKRGAKVTRVEPSVWRAALFGSGERSGAESKELAQAFALRVIEEHGAAKPTSLRHDAAEAICIGYWALTPGLT